MRRLAIRWSVLVLGTSLLLGSLAYGAEPTGTPTRSCWSHYGKIALMAPVKVVVRSPKWAWWGTRWSLGALASAIGYRPHFWYEGAKPVRDVRLFGYPLSSSTQRQIPAWVMKPWRFVEDASVPALQLLLPGLATRLQSPTDPIFWRQQENAVRDRKMPNSVLGKAIHLAVFGWGKTKAMPANTHPLLEKYHLKEDYDRRQKIYEKYPFLPALAQRLNLGFNVGFRSLALLALYHLLQQLQDDDATPTVDTFLKDPRYQPDEDEVHLFVETAPFPHMAIRINGTVYSYGVSHMTTTPVEVYLQKQQLVEFRERIGEVYAHPEGIDPQVLQQLKALFPEDEFLPVKQDTDGGDSSRRSSTSVTHSVKPLALTAFARNIQVVTIKVGKEKKNELIRYFELNNGKRYDNRTFVNDCATMVLRPLGLALPGWDASPSTVITSLNASKLAGNPKVGRIYTVSVDHPENRHINLLRNAYINYLEGSIGFASLPFNLPERMWMDYHHTPEQFQHWDPEIKEVIEGWRTTIDNQIAQDKKIILFRSVADRLAQMDAKDPKVIAKKAKLRQIAGEQLGQEIKRAQADFDNPEANLYEIMGATYRLENLKATQDRIRSVTAP